MRDSRGGAEGAEKNRVGLDVVTGAIVDAALRVHRGLVELKSVEKLTAVHKKQVLTYLRLLDLQVGLLINFGDATLKEGLHPIVTTSLRVSASPREPGVTPLKLHVVPTLPVLLGRHGIEKVRSLWVTHAEARRARRKWSWNSNRSRS